MRINLACLAFWEDASGANLNCFECFTLAGQTWAKIIAIIKSFPRDFFIHALALAFTHIKLLRCRKIFYLLKLFLSDLKKVFFLICDFVLSKNIPGEIV